MTNAAANICDIVICVWNNKDVTKDCLESIYRNTKHPYRLVIIDNASGPETQTYLESVRDDPRFQVILIRNEENLGNTKAVNQGLLATGAKYVCNLDNDTYVTEGWLTEMVAVAESDPLIGVVATRGNGSRPPKSVSPEGIESMAREVARDRGQKMEMAIVDGYCALFKREVIRTVGVWNEDFSPGYFDDTDYCRRVTKAGFKIYAALGAYVYHYGQGSFRQNKRREELFARNRERFHKIHGRPLRILFVDNSSAAKGSQKIKAEAHLMAREANWVWIVKNKTSFDPGAIRHSHVRYFFYAPGFFNVKVIFRVLTRRKKKFDRIYVADEGMKVILNLCKPLHGAEIIKLA